MYFCFIDQMPPNMMETLYFKTTIPDYLFYGELCNPDQYEG